MNRQTAMRAAFLALAGVAGALWTPAAPYVIQKNGIKTDGVALVMNADRSVTLTTAQGAKITFTADQVAEIHVDPPAAYAPAARLLADGKYDDAIRTFTKIATDYQGLEWDDRANIQVARALAGKKDYPAAIARFEAVFRKAPELKKQEEALWAYHGALLAAGELDKLKPLLKQAVAEGSHADAMRAQVMRGDIAARQGDLESALLDYLRTVAFAKTGKDGAPRDLVPQAMLKTAQTLEKMKDARAKDWYRRVAREYPQSPEAAAAKAKL